MQNKLSIYAKTARAEDARLIARDERSKIQLLKSRLERDFPSLELTVMPASKKAESFVDKQFLASLSKRPLTKTPRTR